MDVSVTKRDDWRKAYPLIEVRLARAWGERGLAGLEPCVRVVRLSPLYHGLYWLLIARWSLWCRVVGHAWTNYGCPTCSTFCARRCGVPMRSTP